MPINKCKLGKRNGYRWGKHGKCYPSRIKARKQGIAIMFSQGKIK